jgi:LexA-binding, inner membrane-associated putative hydrolase
MSTIFAHAIAGVTVLEVARRARPGEWTERHWPWTFAALSILPDCDSVLTALFGEDHVSFLRIAGGDSHRGLTHTLLFAVCTGLLVSIAVSRARGEFLRRWLWLSAAVALHPVFDSFTAGGAGMPFFFPFSSRRFRSDVALMARGRRNGAPGAEILQQRASIACLVALALASSFHAYWLAEVSALRRFYPEHSDSSRVEAMKLLFAVVQLTLPFVLLVRAVGKRLGWSARRVAPRDWVVIAMLIAISSTALLLNAA